MTLTPRHRHLISDFEDRRPAPMWPWLLSWVLLFGLAAACGAILTGSMIDEAAWRPLWAGIVGVVAFLIIGAMAAAMIEERRDAREYTKELIRALRSAHGLPGGAETGRRRAD